MDTLRVILVAFCWVLVTGLPSHPGTTHQDAVGGVSSKEIEAAPTLELSKDVTFVHSYNDTKESDQHVSSKLNSFGGLQNTIQNWGGVQKTVLNNRIQYNFYFWLLPKNFTRGNR